MQFGGGEAVVFRICFGLSRGRWGYRPRRALMGVDFGNVKV